MAIAIGLPLRLARCQSGSHPMSCRGYLWPGRAATGCAAAAVCRVRGSVPLPWRN